MEKIKIIGANYCGEINKIREACRAIIIKDNQILVSYENKTGEYQLLGGGRENNETDLACVVREVKEETGYLIKTNNCFLETEELYGDNLIINKYFIAEIIDKEQISLTKEEQELELVARWIPLKELLDILFSFDQYDNERRGKYYRDYRALKMLLAKPHKMNIKLVKPSLEYKDQIIDMLDEWNNYQTDDPDDKTPWAIFHNYSDFDAYLKFFDEKPKPGYVPATTFFALDIDRNIMVGAVSIRHYLNDDLLRRGGHIGDGVRPSERRKGIATEMIRLALNECKKMDIEKVLMVCEKDNIASKKSIIHNGGVLENEVLDEGILIQRYWINI